MIIMTVDWLFGNVQRGRQSPVQSPGNLQVIKTNHSNEIPLPQARYVTEIVQQFHLMTPGRTGHHMSVVVKA